MNPYESPAVDAPVLTSADWAGGPYDFVNAGYGHVVLHVETVGSGVLAVETRSGKQRVLTVTAGERIPLLVRKVLDQTTVAVDGYPSGTATSVAKVRAYAYG